MDICFYLDIFIFSHFSSLLQFTFTALQISVQYHCYRAENIAPETQVTPSLKSLDADSLPQCCVKSIQVIISMIITVAQCADAVERRRWFDGADLKMEEDRDNKGQREESGQRKV